MKKMAVLVLFISAVSLFASEEKSHDPKNHQADMPFYDKGYLNDPIMQFESDVLRMRLDQHIYLVREGSRGGYGASAGSCGCN